MATGVPLEFQISLSSDANSVREGLQCILSSPVMGSLNKEQRGQAELVLAEILNNISEHAYPEQAGLIEVALCRRPDGLMCRITDAGQPMPAGRLPEGRLPVIADIASLPEGGFGWHLIYSLSENLSYHRCIGRNHLSFQFPTEKLD